MTFSLSFQSALRFAVVSDLYDRGARTGSEPVSIRFEVRGGFRQVALRATHYPTRLGFQSALRFAVVSDRNCTQNDSCLGFQSALRFAVVSDYDDWPVASIACAGGFQSALRFAVVSDTSR